MVSNSNLGRFGVTVNWSFLVTSRDYGRVVLENVKLHKFLNNRLRFFEYNSSLLVSHYKINSFTSPNKKMKLFLHDSGFHTELFYDKAHKHRALKRLTKSAFRRYQSRTKLFKIARKLFLLTSQSFHRHSGKYRNPVLLLSGRVSHDFILSYLPFIKSNPTKLFYKDFKAPKLDKRVVFPSSSPSYSLPKNKKKLNRLQANARRQARDKLRQPN